MTARTTKVTARTLHCDWSKRPKPLGRAPFAARASSTTATTATMTKLTAAQMYSLAIRSSLALEHTGAADRPVEVVAHRAADERRHQALPDEEDQVLRERQVQHEDVEADGLGEVGAGVADQDVEHEHGQADVRVAAEVGAEQERLRDQRRHVEEEERPGQWMGRAQDR